MAFYLSLGITPITGGRVQPVMGASVAPSAWSRQEAGSA